MYHLSLFAEPENSDGAADIARTTHVVRNFFQDANSCSETRQRMIEIVAVQGVTVSETDRAFIRRAP